MSEKEKRTIRQEIKRYIFKKRYKHKEALYYYYFELEQYVEAFSFLRWMDSVKSMKLLLPPF